MKYAAVALSVERSKIMHVRRRLVERVRLSITFRACLLSSTLLRHARNAHSPTHSSKREALLLLLHYSSFVFFEIGTLHRGACDAHSYAQTSKGEELLLVHLCRALVSGSDGSVPEVLRRGTHKDASLSRGRGTVRVDGIPAGNANLKREVRLVRQSTEGETSRGLLAPTSNANLVATRLALARDWGAGAEGETSVVGLATALHWVLASCSDGAVADGDAYAEPLGVAVAVGLRARRVDGSSCGDVDREQGCQEENGTKGDHREGKGSLSVVTVVKSCAEELSVSVWAEGGLEGCGCDRGKVKVGVGRGLWGREMGNEG